MKLILDELDRVKALANESDAEFFGNSYKRDREWWVLGHAASILMRHFPIPPIFGEATEPPNADFKIFSANREFLANIEITEAFEDERRRHAEMKERLSSQSLKARKISVIKDPFISFRRVLSEKFEKNYGSKSWLILYFSIMRMEMPGNPDDSWEKLVFDEIHSWTDSELTPELTLSPFDQIFVLDGGGEKLVSIFPSFSVFE